MIVPRLGRRDPDGRSTSRRLRPAYVSGDHLYWKGADLIVVASREWCSGPHRQFLAGRQPIISSGAWS